VLAEHRDEARLELRIEAAVVVLRALVVPLERTSIVVGAASSVTVAVSATALAAM
jgi:hypothetical protein